MSGTARLSALADMRPNMHPGVALPRYEPAAHAPGIVHIGVGAFHQAHQAIFTDDALAAAGGDWRIVGASLRGVEAADRLNPQNGLYTLLERGASGTRARIVGSLAGVIAEPRERGATLAAMTDPAIRIVSLTVTEKAYGIDRVTRRADPGHEAVVADLADPSRPSGVLGLLTEALRRRRDARRPPFTVLCCDNLPENGALLRAGVVDFARRTDEALAAWIAEAVGFPSTMVDRITPAATASTRDEAARLTGCVDLAAVEAEDFSQWVVEDRFVLGRPAWEAGGALFVPDVAPYERMKLRMLNGTHSLLAYAGFLGGYRYVRDIMGDGDFVALARRHLAAAAATLAPLAGIDLAGYARALAVRFANPAIAHEAYQIAMDGTEKLPQRLLQPAAETARRGGDIRPFAFAVAAWMRYCLGRTDEGAAYALRDPREDDIRARLDGLREARDISAALYALPGLFDGGLAHDRLWRDTVEEILAAMLDDGMAGAVAREAAAFAGEGH